MAIKLYKSQLEPTTKSSNVENRAFASMSEAGSIGRAWKGMVQSGEKLYAKHLDYKTDNEVLEKVKEVMNGTENYKGLSETKLNASKMNEPDAAGKFYNDQWQSIFDTVNSQLSGKMAQKKFKSWMLKQNFKDVNAIKSASTENFLVSLQANKLDQIETLKKSILYGTALESSAASKELEILFNDNKTKEIFGTGLDEVIKNTKTEIAFFQYKNVPIDQQAEAIEQAKRDPNIPNDGPYSVDSLINQQETKKVTADYENKNKIKSMESNMKAGYEINADEFAAAIKIATDTEDEKGLLKLKQMQIEYPIYQELKNLSIPQINERINAYQNFQGKDGKGKTTEDITKLRIAKEYLDQLNSELDNDPLKAAANRGSIALNQINFKELINSGDPTEFAKIPNRIASAKYVAEFYDRPVKFFTDDEKKQIQTIFEQSDATDILKLTTSMVQAFGMESDVAFAEFSKDNTFLAHIGGLVMQTGGVGENVKLAVDGYQMMKNEELKKIYKLKTTDTAPVIDEYSSAFLMNQDTYNSTVEAANYIYASQLKQAGKTGEDFDEFQYEKAFKMAAGAKYTSGFIGTTFYDTFYGGFDEHNGNKVYIPSWVKEGKFDDVVEALKENPDLIAKGSTNGKAPVDINLELIDPFGGDKPYFVSVGDGEYLIGIGDNPKNVTGEPEYLLNSDGGLFKININNIKADLTPIIK